MNVSDSRLRYLSIKSGSVLTLMEIKEGAGTPVVDAATEMSGLIAQVPFNVGQFPIISGSVDKGLAPGPTPPPGAAGGGGGVSIVPIAGAIGGVLVIALAALIVFIGLRTRKRRRDMAATATSATSGGDLENTFATTTGTATGAAALSATNAVVPDSDRRKQQRTSPAAQTDGGGGDKEDEEASGVVWTVESPGRRNKTGVVSSTEPQPPKKLSAGDENDNDGGAASGVVWTIDSPGRRNRIVPTSDKVPQLKALDDKEEDDEKGVSSGGAGIFSLLSGRAKVAPAPPEVEGETVTPPPPRAMLVDPFNRSQSSTGESEIPAQSEVDVYDPKQATSTILAPATLGSDDKTDPTNNDAKTEQTTIEVDRINNKPLEVLTDHTGPSSAIMSPTMGSGPNWADGGPGAGDQSEKPLHVLKDRTASTATLSPTMGSAPNWADGAVISPVGSPSSKVTPLDMSKTRDEILPQGAQSVHTLTARTDDGGGGAAASSLQAPTVPMIITPIAEDVSARKSTATPDPINDNNANRISAGATAAGQSSTLSSRSNLADSVLGDDDGYSTAAPDDEPMVPHNRPLGLSSLRDLPPINLPPRRPMRTIRGSHRDRANMSKSPSPPDNTGTGETEQAIAPPHVSNISVKARTSARIIAPGSISIGPARDDLLPGSKTNSLPPSASIGPRGGGGGSPMVMNMSKPHGATLPPITQGTEDIELRKLEEEFAELQTVAEVGKNLGSSGSNATDTTDVPPPTFRTETAEIVVLPTTAEKLRSSVAAQQAKPPTPNGSGSSMENPSPPGTASGWRGKMKLVADGQNMTLLGPSSGPGTNSPSPTDQPDSVERELAKSVQDKLR